MNLPLSSLQPNAAWPVASASKEATFVKDLGLETGEDLRSKEATFVKDLGLETGEDLRRVHEAEVQLKPRHHALELEGRVASRGLLRHGQDHLLDLLETALAEAVEPLDLAVGLPLWIGEV